MSSLLDSARRLDLIAGSVHYETADGRCPFCEDIPSEEGHAANCPTRALPRIAAALEAAERLVGTAYVTPDDRMPDSLLRAPNINALVAALRDGTLD